MKYITSTIVRTTDLALNGNLFGGTLLRWLDEYGGLYVYKYLHHIFVTYKMGETYFLKTAKLGELIDFYVDDVKFNKISVVFDLIAKANESQKEIIHTNMTFVSIDIQSEKPVVLNPFLFERNEFDKFISQRILSKNIEAIAPKLTGISNLDEYKKKYLAATYLILSDGDKGQGIARLQKDWGKIFNPNILLEISHLINNN